MQLNDKNKQKEFEEQHYSDTIIRSFHVILNCIGKIDEFTPNFSYIMDLSERVTKQLKNIADPE